MLLVVYIVDANSFLETWKGRAFYLFFLWLFTLEFILGNGGGKQEKGNSGAEWARAVLGVLVLLIPTIYFVETQMLGLNSLIVNFGKFLGVGQGFSPNDFASLTHDSFPLSIEYLVVAASLTTATYFLLGLKGLKQFSISLFLLGAIGAFYMIDTFRPYGNATMLQSLVPYTASSAAYVLQNTGHAVQMVVLAQDGGVQMLVNGAGFLIYWPCAGVHSLFIYTFVILLFLKGSPMSFAGKAVTLAIGAIGTFFVNVLRIVSIIQITITSGSQAGEYFHNYYGELYFLTWIIAFLTVLFVVQRFLFNRKHSSVA